MSRKSTPRRLSTVPQLDEDSTPASMNGDIPLRRASRSFVSVPPVTDRHQRKQPEYTSALLIMCVLRMVDFLGTNMVIPTLNEYMKKVGGTEEDYYNTMSVFAGAQFLSCMFLGIYVDNGPNRMLPAFSVTISLSIIGNLLYVLAGSVESLHHPNVLLCARLISGIGAGNSVLAMIFMGEVCTPLERQQWSIRYGITRSQGLFWGPPVAMLLATMTTSDMGVWGSFSTPGWFQVVTLPILWILLVKFWPELEDKEHDLVEGDESVATSATLGGSSLISFFRQGRTISVMVSMVIVGISQQAVEVVVPVMTEAALGWHGTKCGSPLTLMAVFLTAGQFFLTVLTSRGVQDRVFFVAGVCMYPFCQLLPCLVWYFQGGYGSVAVVGPLLPMCGFAPFCMLGAFSLWTRMVMESVPQHQGKCQAVRQNVVGIATVLAPMWLEFVYSEQKVKSERLPFISFAWTSVICFCSALCVLATHGDTKRSLRQHSLSSKLTSSN